MNCEVCIHNRKNCEFPAPQGCCDEYDIKRAIALNGENFYCNRFVDIDREKTRIETRSW